MTTNKILVIGDAHVTDKQPLRRFDWLAQHVSESPDYSHTVIIGDFLTLNALSAWDRDKRKLMEDRRFFNEIAAGNLALDKIEATCGSLGKKIFIEGNHEERLKRYMEYHPEWDDGPINIPDLLNLKQRGWQYVNYRDYIHVGGIAFTHIPHGKIREIGGKDICSKAEATTVTSVVFGHCFSWDTEILTLEGWTKPGDLNEYSIVATMNKDTRNLEWQKITGMYQYDHYKELVHFKNNAMDLLVTPDHGMVAESLVAGSLLLPKAADWYKDSKAIVALENGMVMQVPTFTHDELRLLVQCVTDGSQDKGKYWRWHLKKQRKIDRLTALLSRMGIEYSEYRTKTGTMKIYVGELPAKFTKKLPESLMWANKEEHEVILDEWSQTDGTVYKNKTFQLQTTKREHADTLQAMCAINGTKSSVSENNGCYIVCVRVGVSRASCSQRQGFNKGLVPYEGKVWCVSVPNGTLLVRRNGKTVVTQNTHELHTSCVHKQGQQHLQQILNVGCFFEQDEDYVKGRMTQYWRGVVELDNYSFGRFDISTVSMGRLKREYEKGKKNV